MLFMAKQVLLRSGEAKQTLSTSLRFELINRTIRQYGIKGLTRHLGELAEVSVSGYYRWLSAEETRQRREEADARVIKMNLENEDNVVMNHNKIFRLMRKYHLIEKYVRLTLMSHPSPRRESG